MRRRALSSDVILRHTIYPQISAVHSCNLAKRFSHLWVGLAQIWAMIALIQRMPWTCWVKKEEIPKLKVDSYNLLMNVENKFHHITCKKINLPRILGWLISLFHSPIFAELAKSVIKLPTEQASGRARVRE